MKQTLKDYGIHMKQVPLYYDNESAIKIANNPVQHSKTKHIKIRHHFLRDHVMKKDIDIMLSVCMCARFQAAPKESHHLAVKRILRYLAHTPTLGLWYPKGSEFDLVGFSDADYAGDKVDRKSTSGTCHFLG